MGQRSLNREGLTAMQALFVEKVVEFPGNFKKAAEEAGFLNPTKALGDLLAKEPVREAIMRRQAEIRDKTDVRVVQVVEEVARVAFFDPRVMFNDNQTLRSIKDLPPEAARCIKDFKVVERIVPRDDGTEVTVRTVEVKLHDKMSALHQLALHLGFYKDQGKDTGDGTTNLNVNNTIVIDWNAMTNRAEIEDAYEQRIAREGGKPSALIPVKTKTVKPSSPPREVDDGE